MRAGRGDGKFSPRGKGVELLWSSVFTKVLPPNSGPALRAQVTGSTTANVNKRTRETGTDVDLISEAPQPLVSSRGPPTLQWGRRAQCFEAHCTPLFPFPVHGTKPYLSRYPVFCVEEGTGSSGEAEHLGPYPGKMSLSSGRRKPGPPKQRSPARVHQAKAGRTFVWSLI